MSFLTRTSLEAARRYLAAGLQPIPVSAGSKNPGRDGWPEERYDAVTLEAAFRNGCNVGVLGGAPSGGLVDIDLDCPEALAAATVFLPQTHCIFGRPSRRRSHYIYRVTPAPPTTRYRDPVTRTSLVEVRSTGSQTIWPPSVHPTGEPVSFDADGTPETVDTGTLDKAVRQLAVTALVARHWPRQPGARHELALALAGFLLRRDVEAPVLQQILETATRIAGDEESQDRGRAVETTAARLAAGEPTTGGPSLADLLERRVVTRLERWICLEPRSSTDEPGNRSRNVPSSCTDPDPSRNVPPPQTSNPNPGALDIDGLDQVVRKYLLIEDPALLIVLVGAVLAHRLAGDPVWLLLVAPPGATKTEPLRALYDVPGIYPLSELTAKTFASGLGEARGIDPSLLRRLSDQILVLKDFTTVLEMRREDRQAILAQLREIYDGLYAKTWGTGRELRWEGRLGFVAGVTPIIDRHQGAMSILGERFVLFRSRVPDRLRLALKALQGAGSERKMRQALRAAMAAFFAGRGSTPPVVPDGVLHQLARVADFITRARSGVQRDGFRRELEYAPEPEAPTRFAKVLLSLARGIALAFDSPEVTPREVNLVLRVALDCLPLVRHRVIAALVKGAVETEAPEAPVSTSDVAGCARFSTTAVRRALEDLQALDVVSCQKGGRGKADLWMLAAPWGDVFQMLVAASDPSPNISGTPLDGTAPLLDRSLPSETAPSPNVSGTPPGEAVPSPDKSGTLRDG
jgi:hypothetical protein